jgi:hypothetical protein
LAGALFTTELIPNIFALNSVFFHASLGPGYDVIHVRAGWRRLSSAAAAAVAVNGCATSTPPHVASATVVAAQQDSSQVPPAVRVRALSPEEVDQIGDFPGKKSQEWAARVDSLGSMVLAPVLLVFFLPEFLNPDNWHFGSDP